MATIQYKIFSHHKKNDGTFNVKYCLTHKGKQLYHSSAHFAKLSELRKKGKSYVIRPSYLLEAVESDVSMYRKRITELGESISGMDAREILNRITESRGTGSIDFVLFSRKHIESLVAEGREGYAFTLRGTLNTLIDFFDSEAIPVTSITSAVLRDFEKYIRTERNIKRMGGQGKLITKRVPASDNTGVNITMGKLRVLFNACRAAHNTETNIRIPGNPFEFYKIPRANMARKRGGDLDADDIMAIRDYPAAPGSLAELGRDIFLMSFYLCGMNAIDIYHYSGPRTGRVEYERAKTRSRRMDSAFISIMVVEQVVPLLDQYTVKYLHRRYAKYPYFITAINSGLAAISEAALGGRPLTFYHARHTFATLAYNKCGFSKDWIAQALNHSDRSLLMTERYIAADWSVVDKVQAGVLGLLSS